MARESLINPRNSKKLQREFSRLIDDAKQASLDLSLEDRARAKSCGSKGASLYLVGPLTYDTALPDFFLPTALFNTAIRLRLGLRVRDETVTPCRLCGKHPVDAYGHKAIACMLSGMRSRVHNRVRDVLADLYRQALVTPTPEPHAFPSAPNLRADLSFYFSGIQNIVDVALTHPLRDAVTAAAAERADGGAATQYELVKINKYGSILPPSGKLVPFIVDTYGALGKAAVAALTQLIPLFAQRLGITYVVAARIAYGRITGAVIRGVAGIAALA